MNAEPRCSSLPFFLKTICQLKWLLTQRAIGLLNNYSAPKNFCQPLATHELASFRNIRLECQRGKVWITETGSVHDTILTSGEVFEPENDVLVVVQALEPSLVLLKPKLGGLKP